MSAIRSRVSAPASGRKRKGGYEKVVRWGRKVFMVGPRATFAETNQPTYLLI